MLRRRTSTVRSKLLLLFAVALVAFLGMCAQAFAYVPISGPGGWQTGAFYVTITDGYSYNNGATMSCSDSGGGSYMTYYGAGANNSIVRMEQQWYVYGNGVHNFYCTVENSNKTASDSGSATFYEDNMTPGVGISVYGGTPGANGWYIGFPGVTDSYWNVGPSGVASNGCSGSTAPGADWWVCTIQDNNGLSSSSGTTIYYDPYTPSASTNISGGASSNGWYRSAPTISAGAGGVGPSGVAATSCTGLSNGTNSVTCTVRDNNGLQSTDGATTVRLDTQVPTTNVTNPPASFYTSAASIPALNVSGSEPTNLSGVISVSCVNSNNSSGNYSVTQGVSAGASLSGTYPTSDLKDGTNTVTCTTTTGAGNTSSASFTVKLYTQVPTVVQPPALASDAPVADNADTLKAGSDTWNTESGGTATLAYQWQYSPDGSSWSNISGATSATYAPTWSLYGNLIRVVVTATDPAYGLSATANSEASSAVVGYYPVNTTTPSVNGTMAVGNTLTEAGDVWSASSLASNGSGTTDTGYGWNRCATSTSSNCPAISGATAQTYTVRSLDIGSSLQAAVTKINGGAYAGNHYSTTANSSATSATPTALTGGGICRAITSLGSAQASLWSGGPTVSLTSSGTHVTTTQPVTYTVSQSQFGAIRNIVWSLDGVTLPNGPGYTANVTTNMIVPGREQTLTATIYPRDNVDGSNDYRPPVVLSVTIDSNPC